MQAPPGGMPRPGQMPTPEQIAAMQRQIAIDAQKAGMSIPEFLQHIRKQQLENQARMQQQQQQQGGAQHNHDHGHDHGHDHDHSHDHNHNHDHPHPHPHAQQQARPGQPQPIVPGPPNPMALALAQFLRSQDMKPRVSILNGERKEMFRVKRALRAIESPAYEKFRTKNPTLNLPEVKDRASLENTFKLLPMSMLALRVSKVDEPKKGKRVKGLWTVKIEPQQEAQDDMYYVWLWEGSQIMRKVYAALAILVIFTVVLYPLWPLKMRQGVYYLSWGFLMLLGLFFAMAIFRVILFCVTYFVLSPGLWLYPNLWEDVSFMDSFRPVWAWHETAKKKKKSSSRTKGSSHAQATFSAATGQAAPATATTTATNTTMATATPQQRSYTSPSVEELADDE